MADPRDVLKDPPSRFFAALGAFTVRFRTPIILATLALCAASVWITLTTTRIDTSVEKFADKDDAAHDVLNTYRDEFGRDEMFFIVAVGDVFSRPFVERLAALHEEAAALDLELGSLGQRGRQGGLIRERLFGPDSPVADWFRDDAPPEAAPPPDAGPPDAAPAAGDDGFEDGFGDGGDDGFDFDSSGTDAGWGDEAGGTVVEQAISLINARRTRATPGGIEVGQLMDPLPTAAALAAMKAEVLADETLVGQVVGEGGRHAAIALRTAFMSEADSARVYEALLALIERHRAEGFELHVSGVPALNAGLTDLLMDDLITLVQLSALAMFLIMAYLFRHPIAVLAPLFVVALSSIVTAAGMGLFGLPLTMMSNVLPAFLFCVGIGHSVHIISVYRDALRAGLESDDAIRYAVASTGRPVLYTSLTTMVGLASFVFASLEVIGEMGVSGAFGVFVAFVLSVTFLPACLTFNRKGHPMGASPLGEEDGIDRFLARCLALSGLRDDPGIGAEAAVARTRRRRSLGVMLLLIAVAVGGASLMRMYHNPLVWLPADTPMRVAFDLMDEEVGGTGNVQLLIDGTPDNGIKDIELMRGLEALRAHIEAFEHPEYGRIVGSAVGVLDVVKETHRALRGGAQSEYRLPDSDRAVSDLLFMFENAGPDELRRLATTDLQRAQETIRVPWLEATRYQPLVDHIAEGVERHIPDDARVQATGSIYTLVSTVGHLLRDLVASFGAAFAVITVIMMLLLGSVRLGLIAMVPNLMPIVMIGGVMGFGGIPIDMNNLLIASISIGVAVDDTIHLLHHWRVNMQRTGNVEESLRRAMRHSGRAMVSTSLILLIGFSVYLGATMYNIQRFGLLVGLTAVMALLIDLIFAPALLRTFYPRIADKEAPS